jgi:hypothetical protein
VQRIASGFSKAGWDWEARVKALLAYAELKFRARQLSEEALVQKVEFLVQEEEQEEGRVSECLGEAGWGKVQRVWQVMAGGRGNKKKDRNEAVHRIMWEGEEEGKKGRGPGPFAGVVTVAEEIAQNLASDCRKVAGAGMTGRALFRGEGGGGKRELVPVRTERGKKRRRPLNWSDMELRRLLQGLALFGQHRSLIWVKVKGYDDRSPKPVLTSRSPLDVKDKARNIERNVIREMEMRGQRFPEEWWAERQWAKLALSDHALFLSLQGGGK